MGGDLIVREEQAEGDRSFESEAFLRRIADGDEAAWESLVKHFNAPLFKVACRIVRDPEECEDVMIRVWNHFFRAMALGQFHAGRRLFPYLCRIAINEALSCLRTKKTRIINQKRLQAGLKRELKNDQKAARNSPVKLVAAGSAILQTLLDCMGMKLSKTKHPVPAPEMMNLFSQLACDMRVKQLASAWNMTLTTAHRQLNRIIVIMQDCCMGHGIDEEDLRALLPDERQ